MSRPGNSPRLELAEGPGPGVSSGSPAPAPPGLVALSGVAAESRGGGSPPVEWLPAPGPGTRSCHDATESSSATGDDLVGRRSVADLAGVTRRRERESFDTCGTGSGTEDGGHRSYNRLHSLPYPFVHGLGARPSSPSRRRRSSPAAAAPPPGRGWWARARLNGRHRVADD